MDMSATEIRGINKRPQQRLRKPYCRRLLVTTKIVVIKRYYYRRVRKPRSEF